MMVDKDLQSALEKLARTAPTPQPFDDFMHRARRGLRLQRVELATTVAAVSVATGVIVRSLAYSDLSRGPNQNEVGAASGPATPTASETSSIGNACDFAPVEPTYLPWLEEGEDVPPPVRYRDDGSKPDDEGTGDAVMGWSMDWKGGDESSHEAPSVHLTTRTVAEPDDARNPVDVRVDGEEGSLELGPGSGYATVSWVYDRETCNQITLQVNLSRDASEKATERETRKVAKSLR